MKSKLVWLALVFVPLLARAQDDVPLRAMKDELARSIGQIQLQKMDKPYFLAYRMDEMNQTSISATLGSLTNEQPTRVRLIAVEVRVGDYALDNSNYLSAESFGGGMFGNIRQAPLDDNYLQIRRDFWLATDTQYKKALENLSAKRAVLEMRKRADDTPDFSKESPAVEMQSPVETKATNPELEGLARRLSAAFQGMPEIFGSSVDIQRGNHFIRYTNSEGSSFTRSQPTIKLQIRAQTQAADGLPISDSIEIFGRSISDLPSEDALLTRTRVMAERIVKLRAANSLDNYTGPVLFEGDAAAELFSQQFAVGLVAARTPVSDNPRFEMMFNQMMSRMGGASFADKIGGRLLPAFLSVSDDPLLNEYKGSKLFGGNTIDDDAVKPREVKLVDYGILKTLLATRIPVRAVLHSTGSRRGWGAAPSNLIVTSDKSLSAADLRKQLLDMAKARGFDFGIVVRRIGGGAAASLMKMAASMGQQGEQSGVGMAEIYKVYPDGREEILRGMEIAETTPSLFKDIVAVGDTPTVFTDEFIPRMGALFSSGFSGSPNAPVVSYVVPPMLLEELSLRKSEGPFPNPPISPSPLAKQ